MGSRLSESNTAAQTILYHIVGLIFQTGSDHGDRTAIGLGLIVHSAEDDIDIISCQFLYIACCIGCICQSYISGDIDNDMGCTGNGSLQKGTLYCHLHSFHCLIIALALTDTDVSNTLVLHNGLYICKVQINDSGNIDQIRDSLYCLLQNFICLLQSFRHCGTSVHDLQQLIIGYHNQGIHVLFDTLDTV